MNEPKKPNAPMLASIGAAVLVGVLVLSYLLSSGGRFVRESSIELPNGEQNEPVLTQDGALLTADQVAGVEITTDNVKKVIASLRRPADYSCRIENKLFYSGGASSLYCRRYARDGVVRTDNVSDADEVLTTLLRAQQAAYSWDAGASSFYKGAWGDFSDDAAAMLPSYEDVLDEGIVITAASKTDDETEPSVRLEFVQNGYRCIYEISAASGLLKSASFYSGETLTRQVVVSEMTTETPDAALFALPNGASVLGE